MTLRRSTGSPLFVSVHHAFFLLGAFLLAVGLVACRSGGEDESGKNAPPVVEVTAVDYAFAAPDTIESGWTTFAMKNEGKEHHNFELERLPRGKTFSEYREKFMRPTTACSLFFGRERSTRRRTRTRCAAPFLTGIRQAWR